MRLLAILTAAALGLPPAAVRGEVPAEEAAKLGKTLTPMGAEKAGNAAGTIPAWTGGVTNPVEGYKASGHYPDPFVEDKAILTIAAKNADEHEDKLTSGHLALLKKYPSYFMKVFPSRRSSAFPKEHYDETLANATSASLVEGGNGVTGTSGGIPFPIPKSGLEVIWNHLLRYRGDSYHMFWSQAAVTRGGEYTLVRFDYEYDFEYGNLSKKPEARAKNKVLNFLQTVTSPARLAGQILLVYDYADQVKQPRKAWTYNPGQRRVRLAPQVAYDNPGTAADGLRTNDDFSLFNGATDRYEWKLVGKREIYVPYDSYKLSGDTLKYSDILKPLHINQEHARYELHRVWVVDSTLKKGTSHVYHRRTYYVDEDSWTILAVDKYDSRGDLWRVSEYHSINFYDWPMTYGTLELHVDLQSGRYLAMGLRNEEPKVYEKVKRSPSYFTPAGLRGLGTR